MGGQAKYLIITSASAGHFSIFADQYEITESQASDCVLLSARWVSTKHDNVTVFTLLRLCIARQRHAESVPQGGSAVSLAPADHSHPCLL